MKNCPQCGSEGRKVIFLGFPMRLCLCNNVVFGFWSWIPFRFPVGDDHGFKFMGYTGSYWSALYYWLRYGTDDLPEYDK